MAAYIYGEIEITDAEGYEAYRRDVPGVIAAHGGRYRVRGGAVTVLEGEASARRRVILEFPDMAALLGFYHSAEYQALAAVRQRCSTGTIVAIEGPPE